MIKRVPALVVMFLTSFTLASCGDAQPEADAGTELSFAPELGVDEANLQETGSGLRYQDLEVGTGEPASAGDVVIVHYTGWLPSGESFDSSISRGEPFSFHLGNGDVIAGWEEGVEGMQVGGRRQLVIPPALAYGADGAGGVIPPNATLVFEVELLEIQ